MFYLNEVKLIGYVANDIELRQSHSGTTVCNFTIVTNSFWRDPAGQKKEKAQWTKLVAWGKRAEICSKRLKKGTYVYIQGYLQTRSFIDQKTNIKKYVTEVVAEQIGFIDYRKQEEKKEEYYENYSIDESPIGNYSDIFSSEERTVNGDQEESSPNRDQNDQEHQ